MFVVICKKTLALTSFRFPIETLIVERENGGGMRMEPLIQRKRIQLNVDWMKNECLCLCLVRECIWFLKKMVYHHQFEILYIQTNKKKYAMHTTQMDSYRNGVTYNSWIRDPFFFFASPLNMCTRHKTNPKKAHRREWSIRHLIWLSRKI